MVAVVAAADVAAVMTERSGATAKPEQQKKLNHKEERPFREDRTGQKSAKI